MINGKDQEIITINKTGNNGIFGKLEILNIDSDNNEKIVGRLNGANIYRESSHRKFVIKIAKDEEQIDLSTMRVRFTDVTHNRRYIDEPLKAVYQNNF